MTSTDTDLDAFAIGLRLQSLRQAAKISQRALARDTGVSHATISLIEHGKLNPSFGVLMKLLGGLEISISEFLEGPLPAQDNKVFFPAQDLNRVRLNDGKITYSQIAGQTRDRAMLFQHEVYEPGSDTGDTRLAHDSEEAGIIIDGQLEVTVGDQRRILKAGDCYYFNSRIPHRFRNIAARRCVLVTSCVPPSF